MKTKFAFAMAIAVDAKKAPVMQKKFLPVLILAVLSFYFINSNAQTNTKLGTDALAHNTGIYNTALGYHSMVLNTTGDANTATGALSLYSNTTGSSNTAIGDNSMSSNKASFNTAIGASSMRYNTTGTYNTANGYRAMYFNRDGSFNTASGYLSLYYNETGYSNTANGYRSLYSNTTGNSNTANGHAALYLNKTGAANTASGRYSLYSNTSGSSNTAYGVYSLYKNETGLWNTASGYQSLYSNTTGLINTAIGYQSLYSNITGSYNTALGTFANVLASNLTNATAIGYDAKVDASNKVVIGNTFVTSIGGQIGWTTFSDGRYKKDIKENIQGLAFINSLRPISYTVNVKGLNEYYNKGRKQVTDNQASGNIDEAVNAEMKKGEDVAGKMVHNGFIAQEVEEAAKKLNFAFGGVDKPESKDGLYGLRYENFIVPLVKAVQELSKQNEDLQEQINQLKSMKIASPQSNVSSLSSTNVTPGNASLEQNMPNPFNKTTTIRYNLPQTFTNAQIVIIDKSGKILKQVNISGSGRGTVNIDAATLNSGAYNYSLIIDGRVISSKQMVLTK